MGNGDATNLINGKYKGGKSIVECVILSDLNVKFIKFDVSMLFFGLWKYFPEFSFCPNSYEWGSPEGITAQLCELVEYFWKDYGIRFIPTLDGERSVDKSRSPGKQTSDKDKVISHLLNAAGVYHIASTAEADHALSAPFIDAAIRTHFGLPEDALGAIFTKDSDIFSNGAFDPSRVIITSYDQSTKKVAMYTQGAFQTAFCKRYEVPPATAPQTAFLVMKNWLAATSREYVGYVRVLGFSRRVFVGHLKEILPSLPQDLKQQTGLILAAGQDFLAAAYQKIEAEQLQLAPVKQDYAKLINGGERAVREGLLARYHHNTSAFVGIKDGTGNVILEPRPVSGEDASNLEVLPGWLRRSLLDPTAPIGGDGSAFHTVIQNQEHVKSKLVEKAKLILVTLSGKLNEVLNTSSLKRIVDATEVVTTRFSVASPTAHHAVLIAFLAAVNPVCLEEACEAVSVKPSHAMSLFEKVSDLLSSFQARFSDLDFATALSDDQMQRVVQETRASAATRVVDADVDEDPPSDDEDVDFDKDPELEPGYSFIGRTESLYIDANTAGALGLDGSVKEIGIHYKERPLIVCTVCYHHQKGAVCLFGCTPLLKDLGVKSHNFFQFKLESCGGKDGLLTFSMNVCPSPGYDFERTEEEVTTHVDIVVSRLENLHCPCNLPEVLFQKLTANEKEKQLKVSIKGVVKPFYFHWDVSLRGNLRFTSTAQALQQLLVCSGDSIRLESTASGAALVSVVHQSMTAVSRRSFVKKNGWYEYKARVLISLPEMVEPILKHLPKLSDGISPVAGEHKITIFHEDSEKVHECKAKIIESKGFKHLNFLDLTSFLGGIGVYRGAGFHLCIKPRPGSKPGTFDLLVEQADEYKKDFAASEEKLVVVEVIPGGQIYINKIPWVVEQLPSPDGGDVVLYSENRSFEGAKLVSANGSSFRLIGKKGPAFKDARVAAGIPDGYNAYFITFEPCGGDRSGKFKITASIDENGSTSSISEEKGGSIGNDSKEKDDTFQQHGRVTRGSDNKRKREGD
jgi:hypothetical protein